MRRERDIKCGIYMWEVIMPGKWFGAKYIGQSIDISCREKQHISQLKNDSHYNYKLQKFIKKYGVDTLQFSILLECSKIELDFWERWFIKSFDTYKTRLGFNFTEGGRGISYNICKKCTFTNMITNETVQFNSIAEFTQKYNIDPTCASEVLSGKRNYTGDWYNTYGNYKPIFYNLISPSGIKYRVLSTRAYEFRQLHGIRKDGFSRLIKNRQYSANGWTLENQERLPYSDTFKVIDPNGNVYEVKHIAQFARDHNLCKSSLCQLKHRTHNHHNGWKLYA